jgi:hypothetical protein
MHDGLESGSDTLCMHSGTVGLAANKRMLWISVSIASKVRPSTWIDQCHSVPDVVHDLGARPGYRLTSISLTE